MSAPVLTIDMSMMATVRREQRGKQLRGVLHSLVKEILNHTPRLMTTCEVRLIFDGMTRRLEGLENRSEGLDSFNASVEPPPPILLQESQARRRLG